jgi:S-formylglutathione hydrolase
MQPMNPLTRKTRLRQFVIAAVLATVALTGHAATPAADHAFVSASLKRTMPYRVILPVGYASGTARYPVLYLLHGYSGAFGNWTDHTQVAEYAATHALIIVMPEGANSWYVDGANGEAWETYLTRDLITEIDTTLRTKNTRADRMIAGLSMGGYGAIKAGLKHPELYALAASFSGALDITRPGDVFKGERKPDVMAIFGPAGSKARAANDVFALAAAADPATSPYFWIGCGTNDPWLEPNREMARALKTRGLAYEYHERPGGHEWTFWDWAIKSLLADPHVPAK